MRQSVVVIMAGMIAFAAMRQPAPAQSVAQCATPGNCVQVAVTAPSDTKRVGDVATVGLTFTQGPASGGQGGADKIAALALTLQEVGGGTATPLVLNDCTLNADGLPAAVNDSALSGFRVVVENTSCTNGRTHCLCPDAGSGITPDNFINIVVYGPNPLPTPGTSVDIPVLPSGQLLTIDLKVASGANGSVNLHILNQVADASPAPQPKALLSVGDKTAVDQTCSPLAVSGTPPCAAAGSVSQVAFTDASVTVAGGCTGDCNGGGTVTVDEIITMVNIALSQLAVSECTPGDADRSGTITIDEILSAVNNAIGGCPGA